MSKLIVGLGNPGVEYELTRHNIGWLTMDYLEQAYKLNFKEKFKGLYADTQVNGEKIYFLKPQTFMNLSGESVVALSQFFKVDLSEMMVIHDELDLPFGQLLFKKGGGLAGHNGLKSIAGLLGTPDFIRLRMGIGRPVHGSVSNYVLSPFRDEEIPILEDFIKLASSGVDTFIKQGYEKAANAFSKKKIS